MDSIKVETREGNYKLNLPTSINEITKEYLTEVTKGVMIADEYSLIAIISKVSPFAVSTAKTNTVANVTPLFVKAGNTNNDFIQNLNCKDIVVITGSDISLGIHINIKENDLSLSKIQSYLESNISMIITDFKNSNKEKNIKLYQMKTDYYFVSFKLIPNCNIHGTIKSTGYNSGIITKID